MPFDPTSDDGYPDDWFVPGQSPGRTAPWSPGTDHFFPDDWIYPDNRNAPTPAAAPSSAPPAPSLQPNAVSPAIPDRPAPRPDPFAAYWAMIPASRLTAVAWAPPIFPDAFGRFPLLPPAPAPRYLPLNTTSGPLGGIPKMLQANGLLPYQPALLDVGNDPSGAVDALGALQATPNGLTDPGAPPSSPEGSLTLGSFGANQSTLDGGSTATNAAYYRSPLDQILPCFVSSVGCAGGGGGNRGGGGGEVGGGSAGPRPSPPSAPRAPAPGPRPSSPTAPETPAPELKAIGEPPTPAEPGAGGRDVAPPVPALPTPQPQPPARAPLPLLTPLEQLPPGSVGGVNAGKRFPRSNPYQQGTPCMYCDQTTTNQPGGPNSLESDHIFPRSRGGNSDPANRGPACLACNRQKGPRTPEEWYLWLLQRDVPR
jgi:5-methylcytosine-specific restriction endonuclease McrA